MRAVTGRESARATASAGRESARATASAGALTWPLDEGEGKHDRDCEAGHRGEGVGGGGEWGLDAGGGGGAGGASAVNVKVAGADCGKDGETAFNSGDGLACLLAASAAIPEAGNGALPTSPEGGLARSASSLDMSTGTCVCKGRGIMRHETLVFGASRRVFKPTLMEAAPPQPKETGSC